MENFRQVKIDFDYSYSDKGFGLKKFQLKELNCYIEKLNNVFKKESQNFADLCYYVYQVKALFYGFGKYCYDKKNQYYNFDKIMDQFGISATEVSRLCACYDKFIETTLSEDRMSITSYKIKDLFFPFSKSKLFELLAVETSQLETDIKNKVLREDMSVASIRQYVKNYKSLEKANNKLNEKQEDNEEDDVEEEIPMAYNVNTYYEFKYFESKSKAELLNIVWELQKRYHETKKASK